MELQLLKVSSNLQECKRTTIGFMLKTVKASSKWFLYLLIYQGKINVVSATTDETEKYPIAPLLKLVVTLPFCTSNGLPRH